MKKRRKKSEMSIADHLRMARSKVEQTTLASSGTRRAKRVRFEEPDTQHPLTQEPNGCLSNASVDLSSISGNPKTSEFAFYKKLREDAARSSHFYNRHKQQKQLDESEARNYIKEIAKIVNPDYEIRSFTTIEKETPKAHVSTISPKVSVSSGSECKHKDIFSIKREKLLHLAADSLSLDMDKLRPTGYDLVSLLLQRLHPDSDAVAETSCSRSRSKSSDTKFSNNSQLHVSLESDILVQEVPWTPSMNLVSPFAWKDSKSSLLHSWSGTPRESSFSQDLGEEGSILTSLPNRSILECERTRLDAIVDCNELSSLYGKADSGFSMKPGAEFHVNEDDCPALDNMLNQASLVCPTYRNPSLNSCFSSETSLMLNSNSSFNWRDVLSSPNGHASLGRQHNQLLSWSPRTVEKEEYFSNSSCGAELYTSLPWETPSEDNLHCLNSIFSSTGMDSPSVRSIRHCSDLTLRNMTSENYFTDIVGSQDLGEEGSILTWHPNRIILKCERTHLDDIVDCSEQSSLYAKVDTDFSLKPGAEFHVNEDDRLVLDYMPDQPSLLCPTYGHLSSDSGLSSDRSLMLNSKSSFRWWDVLSSPYMLTSLGKQPNQLWRWSPRAVEKEEYFSNLYCGAELFTSLTWRTPSEDNMRSPNDIFSGTGMHSPSDQNICHCSDLALMNISAGKYLTDTIGSQTREVGQSWGTPSEDNLHSPDRLFSSTGMHSPSVRSIHHCSDLTLRNMLPGKYLTYTVGSETPDVRKYEAEDSGDRPLQLWR